MLIFAFFYSILFAIIQINLKPQQAHFLGSGCSITVNVNFCWFLYALNVLDDVLGWGFSLQNSEVRVTIGSLLLRYISSAYYFMELVKEFVHFLSSYFLPKSGIEPALIQGISTLVSYSIIIIGTITALGATGINLTALTVVVGGLSVGLGFGLQAIVSNFISGFVLLFEKSVGPGDVINIADKTGTVQHVGIRSITILTRDHIELIVPNSYYLTEVVTNLTRTSRNIRLATLVGVSYGADPKDVKEALLASAETEFVMKLPAPEVQFMDFGESSLDFRLLVWTNRPELATVYFK